MFDRKHAPQDVMAERRNAALAAELAREERAAAERESLSSWNSWGERSTLTMGSYGRW
ncbi:hypothetical protein [Pseudoroseomonas cervicalis]|uniref:hypothetical protein n=1 Tax=Teichococcus cervicalis TaxID=204525 RepID=UPI0022F1D502|nr:hypothetical protein [Pseudoroseomonas cervicalis]WBV44529.1 hypothetical protein PFY06_08220 [Pseudoroseomonas cervicalis]